MQIVKPDMLPMIIGFMILLLSVIGLIGIVLFIYGIKKNGKRKSKTNSILLPITGTLLIGFVVYNWLGYQSIYSENEQQIVGHYTCTSSNATLEILENNTWTIKGTENLSCNNGQWSYVMSEDWCYWNIESVNMKCNTQTGSSENILFEKQNLEFRKLP